MCPAMGQQLQPLPMLLQVGIHNSNRCSPHALDGCCWHGANSLECHVHQCFGIIQACCTALEHLAQLSWVAGCTDAGLVDLHQGQGDSVQHLRYSTTSIHKVQVQYFTSTFLHDRSSCLHDRSVCLQQPHETPNCPRRSLNSTKCVQDAPCFLPAVAVKHAYCHLCWQ